MQRMPLIILDDELARSPRGLMNVPVQMHPVSPQRVRNRRHIVGFEVQVEMIALLHKRDKWILLVDQFEMKHLTPRPNTRVEILVLEFERAAQLRGVEAYGSREVRGSQLCNDARDAHLGSDWLRAISSSERRTSKLRSRLPYR